MKETKYYLKGEITMKKILISVLAIVGAVAILFGTAAFAISEFGSSETTIVNFSDMSDTEKTFFMDYFLK